jgi:HEPN domain
MDRNEFLAQIEQVDRDLSNENVPPIGRAFRAFSRLAPVFNGPLIGYGIDLDSYGPFEGPNLSRRITDWYSGRYGDRVCLPNSICRVPVLIRQQVYLIRIPIAYGQPRVEILPLVDGLTSDMIRSLDPSEIQAIKSAFTDGYELVYEVDDMRFVLEPNHSPPLSFEAIRILEQAINDRNACADCIDNKLDTNGACFRAQQHAEKMMKAFLLATNRYTETQLAKHPYGHNLQNVFIECLKQSADFASVSNDVSLLRGIPMNVRYSMEKVSLPNIVETIWASLRVGGLCACRIANNQRRYHNPYWIKQWKK